MMIHIMHLQYHIDYTIVKLFEFISSNIYIHINLDMKRDLNRFHM